MNGKIFSATVFAAVFLALIIPCRTNASIEKSQISMGSQHSAMPEGEFLISVQRDGEWREAGKLTFNRFPSERSIDLAKFLSTGDSPKIRLTQKGGGTAHIDAVSLDGRAPQSVEGSGNPLALKKILDARFGCARCLKKQLNAHLPYTAQAENFKPHGQGRANSCEQDSLSVPYGQPLPAYR